MNFPSFISSRIRHNESNTFSATVSRIGVFSIAIGISVGILSFAVLFGYKSAIREKIFLFAPHLRVTSLSVGNNYEEGPLKLNTPLWKAFNTIPNIDRWQAVAHKTGIIKTDQEQKGILMKGIGPDYNFETLAKSLVAGRLIKPSADSTYLSEILVSQKIANELNVKVGDKVLIYFLQNPPRARNITIAGIYQTDLEEFDNNLIIGDLSLIRRLNDWDKETVGSYEVYVRDFEKLDETSSEVFNRMSSDMYLLKVTDSLRPVFDWLHLLNMNTQVLLSLILFVACFNMISILLVMIMERTPLIGLLKTLGSPNQQIRAIFRKTGFYIVSRGLIWGNAIGLLTAWLQFQFHLIPLDPVNYFVPYVPIEFTWQSFLLVNLVSIVVLWLILTIPTLIVTRIEPIKALMFKK